MSYFSYFSDNFNVQSIVIKGNCAENLKFSHIFFLHQFFAFLGRNSCKLHVIPLTQRAIYAFKHFFLSNNYN